MDQKKVYYEYDRRSKSRFYMRLFFDLLELCITNSFIVYSIIAAANCTSVSATALEYRSALSTELISDFTSRQRGSSDAVMSRVQKLIKPKVPHNIEKRQEWKRCVQCKKENRYSRSNNYCSICHVFLCYTTSRDCVAVYHCQIKQ